MARKEADLRCCAITQALVKDYWNWDADELDAIVNGDVQAITQIIAARLTNAGMAIEEMYAIKHDKDTQIGWDDIDMKTVVEYKTNHIHCVVKFMDGKGSILQNIAAAVGLEPQFIEKAGKGKYGYDNLLSYLIHIKYTDKYQYEPGEVFTFKGKPYMLVYELQKELWIKGRSKIQSDKGRADIDWLETMILQGEVVRSQVILTDEYFEIYSRNKRRCDDAFDTYGERRAYKTMQAMENGEFKTSVLFVTGRSHSGKSYFTDYLVKSLKESSKAKFGEAWSSCSVASSNPFDDYNGEEILVMDDLRGASLTASDWLKLLDPDRVNIGGARYRNKRMACRAIIINSEKDVLEFFYFLKNSGGGDRSEAMDQFFRRIMARAVVYRVPDSEERRVGIGEMKETQKYHVPEPGSDARYGRNDLALHHDFVPNQNTADMPYDAALQYLTDMVMSRNLDIKYESEVVV